jgi:hypothetical protein
MVQVAERPVKEKAAETKALRRCRARPALKENTRLKENPAV